MNPDNVEEAVTYSISDVHPDFPNMPISGRAIEDADPATADGPYPLVVYAPGLAGWRQFSAYIPEHLASHGFVTISFDPRGETFESFWLGAATRPADVLAIIDYADDLTAGGGDLAGLIDTDRIGVAGHSSGGWTALVAGGAQFDFGWCDANPDLIYDMSNSAQFVPRAEEIAEMAGLASVPEGRWPPMHDSRVDAVISLAPDGDIWGADFGGVADMDVPTLLIVGTQDTMIPPEAGAYPIYERLGSEKKGLIKFEGADHMIFANTCDVAPWFADVSFWVCSDAVWDFDRAHDLINHFMTAFLSTELKADTDAAARWRRTP